MPVKREAKKEDDEEEDNTPLSSSLKAKKKSIQLNGSREARLKAAAKVKKEEPQSDEDYEEETKPTIKKVTKKAEKVRFPTFSSGSSQIFPFFFFLLLRMIGCFPF